MASDKAELVLHLDGKELTRIAKSAVISLFVEQVSRWCEMLKDVPVDSPADRVLCEMELAVAEAKKWAIND